MRRRGGSTPTRRPDGTIRGPCPGAVIGIAGAVGGLGGVAINLVLRASYQSSGSATIAFWVFAATYLVAVVGTWFGYVRGDRGTLVLRRRVAVPAG